MTSDLPDCRTYLLAPPGLAPDFPDVLEDALSGGDVACLLLPAPERSPDFVAVARHVIRIAQARGVAVLVDGDAGLAAELRADGVHVYDGDAYEDAREMLGENAIVGVGCGVSRHLAMSMGESGADYIAFSAGDEDADAETLEDTIAWWSEVFVVPCVAWGADSLDEAEALAESGADFVAVGAPVWAHAVNPRTGITDLNERFAGTDRAA